MKSTRDKEEYRRASAIKLKMDNSFEFLTGTPESIKKQYEYLSDLVRDSGGKVHGSQSHIIANNSMHLIVYYEVPAAEGQREEVKKRKFENYILSTNSY